MIERAARCLETGGRAAFRGTKKQVRSRRHLHSTFWTHGAGNIDLPAWWILLLQTPVVNDEVCTRRRKGEFQKVLCTGLEDIFLDFLYPVQTLALIRRLKRSATAYNQAAQNAKQYSRSYTSIAKEFITGVKATTIGAEAYSISPSQNQDEDTLRQAISELLDTVDSTERYDELWQGYQDLLEMSQTLSPQEIVKMLRCLISSKRTVDDERALALFESIPVAERRAIHYSHAVSAALALKDVDTALFVHREALSRINGSIGTAAILGFAVQQELWTVAIETWHSLWEHKLSYYTSPDIWAAVDAMPLGNLISKASGAIDFANTVSESTQGEGALAAREFASEVTSHTFRVLGINFDISQHWELVKKTRVLDDAHGSIRTLALEQLLSVDSRDHGRQAVRLYQILRKSTGFSPTRKNLEVITQKVLLEWSTTNLSLIVDDWRNYFSTLPARLAITVAKLFAQHGHVERSQKILDDFVSEHGKPRHDMLYHHMLLAYNRRADTEGIVHCLEYLQETYGFKPGLKAWNLVISTFARIGDVDGALERLQKLHDAGLQPDSSTYFHLMSMYGKRGDLDAVSHLLDQSQEEGVPTTMQMYNAVVLANVNDGNLEVSENLIDQALRMDLQGSRTFMWNVLINAYALRKNVEKVSQLHKRMQELGEPSDNMTYAALMTSLTVAKFPDGARKILDTIMPRRKVKRTALHYAIVMGGYLATRQYGKIFQLYKQMLRSNLDPTMSTQNVLLRAAAAVDKATPSEEITGDQAELIRAKQTFEQTLQNLNPMELATSEPRMFVGANPLNEAFSSTYFEYLIFLYGTDAAFNKVSELYDRYVTTPLPLRKDNRDMEASPPIRLLCALMVSHIRAGNHSEVDRCWNLALEKSEKLACKSNADTFRDGWVLHSRRFIINLPLHHYILSLTTQTRLPDLIDTIHDLHRAGYALNSSNWNKYIQALARSPQLANRVSAFHLCEAELMDSWPGWAKIGDPQYMQRKFRGAQRYMLLRQDQKAPNYLTLVWLARAFLEAKSQGQGGTMRRFEQAGPRTVDAVVNMPRVNDRPQSEILRQEV